MIVPGSWGVPGTLKETVKPRSTGVPGSTSALYRGMPAIFENHLQATQWSGEQNEFRFALVTVGKYRSSRSKGPWCHRYLEVPEQGWKVNSGMFVTGRKRQPRPQPVLTESETLISSI